MQANNRLSLIHFELIHRPQCSPIGNPLADASSQRWEIVTRKSLARFACKLTRKPIPKNKTMD